MEGLTKKNKNKCRAQYLVKKDYLCIMVMHQVQDQCKKRGANPVDMGFHKLKANQFPMELP